MGKLLPHLRGTAQSGRMYYFQKLGFHIFGVFNSSTGLSHVYVSDETTAGDMKPHHVCSYHMHHVQNFVDININFSRIYLDSVAYFKGKYINVVTRGNAYSLGVSKKVLLFMVPRHTNFEPDVMFAADANQFYKGDVSSIEKQLLVVQLWAHSMNMDLHDMLCWKD